MEKLNILWTSDSFDTFKNMISMYTVNSIKNSWWIEINIIIWGASTKLVHEDVKVQKEIQKMIEKGITFEACKACADKFKASDNMKRLGINVKYMGKALTNYIKSEDKFITI